MPPLDEQIHDAHLVVSVQQQITAAADALARNPFDPEAGERMRALLHEPAQEARIAIGRLLGSSTVGATDRALCALGDDALLAAIAGDGFPGAETASLIRHSLLELSRSGDATLRARSATAARSERRARARSERGDRA